mgnify:CR=1 FL=1
MTELVLSNQKVTIEAGELVSFFVDGHEYIHQKGSPGWRSADAEMFPIIGPTNEAGFKVTTAKGEAIQDQHGLLRELAYNLVSNTETTAVYEKKYTANTKVKNSKYPKKSTAEDLVWPYSFTFLKTFVLKANELEVSFKISGEKGMPFMLGYHPAFKLHTKAPVLLVNEKTVTLNEVLAVGSRALEVPNCTTVTLKDEKEITIKSEGFGNFMLWTEVTNMVCIEPVSFYPYGVAQEQLHTGFETLETQEKVFKVTLQIN